MNEEYLWPRCLRAAFNLTIHNDLKSRLRNFLCSVAFFKACKTTWLAGRNNLDKPPLKPLANFNIFLRLLRATFLF